MKQIINAVMLSMMSMVFTLSALADDELISCTTVREPIHYYGGSVQCSAYNASTGTWTTIYDYVPATTISTQWIYQGGLSCFASLPYLYTTYVERQVCDYRPVANFTITQGRNCPVGVTVVTFNSTSHDKEGSIVKNEWFVNGTKLASEASRVSVTKYGGERLTVKLKITDNSGNTAEKTQSLVVQNPGSNCNMY